MTTCKARIKYVALLNVLFYKWLGYPAGISGWHCAAVTTTISPTHACLSMGASPQKSNVRCYPSPLIEKGPAQHRGLAGPASLLATEKHHYWARCTSERVTIAVWRPYYWPFIHFISNRGVAPVQTISQKTTEERIRVFHRQWVHNFIYYTAGAVDLWVMHKNWSLWAENSNHFSTV